MGRIDRLVQGTLRAASTNFVPTKGPRETAAPAAQLAHTPAQRRHVQSEDNLLAKAAEEMGAILPAAPVSAVETPEQPPAPSQVRPKGSAVFKPEAPFATVRGEPGVDCVQGKHYFSAGREWVRQAPEHAWYFPEPPQKKSVVEHVASIRDMAKHAERCWSLNEIPSTPRVIIEAERENAKAAAAEALAE